jgi:hypothetical protein
MARHRHGDPPTRKKAAKKKVAKKAAKKTAKNSAGKSLLERAAAKKRTKAAAETMAPKRAPKSKDVRLDDKVLLQKDGEHPVDTIAKARNKSGRHGAVNLRTNIDEERSRFRTRQLDEQMIDDVCRMLRAGVHRVTTERLLGLSNGRIKKWIRRGKQSREAIESWHEAHDDAVQDGQEFEGEAPAFDIYALFHACVLEAESEGEQTAVSGIINAAIGAGETSPDWRANAWLLSRRYPKRWGSYAEREMVEEEDQINGTEGRTKSATERLAEALTEMVGRQPKSDEEG